MSKGKIPSEIVRQVDSPLSPENVQNKLQSLPFDLQFGDNNGDNIPFHHRQENLHLEGKIHRWHGTESRIEIHAEVLKTKGSPIWIKLIRIMLGIFIFLMMAGLGYIDIIMGCSIVSPYDDCTLFIIMSCCGLIFGFLLGMFGLVVLPSYDPAVTKHIQTYKNMQKMIDDITQLIQTPS